MALTGDSSLADHGPPASFIIMEIHQLTTLFHRTSFVILLSLTHIHKALGKLVTIFNVVSTATPDPLFVEVSRSAGVGTPTC